MRILVTGSQGFLGKHVCAALRWHGHDVVGLDTIIGAEIQADITGKMPRMELDAVLHLAAMAAPLVCDKNPGLAFNVNVNGTHQVLRLSLESGAKKFVFSSSAHVYGVGPKYLPTDESHPLWLQNTYTTTKILGEQLCHLFYENHGLSYTTLRLYNAYGPGQSQGYFIPDMMEKARNGGIELRGGNTTKDFVYVADVAEAFCRAVKTDYVGPINIGTGVESPLSDVADTIAKEYNAAFQVTFSAASTRMAADWKRAKSVLEWMPTVELEDGLDATFRAIKDASPIPA